MTGPPEIDYFLSAASPFALLGHAALRAVAERHGATVRFRPVDVAGLWAVSGAVMPAQRPPVRQRYRLVELQRLRLQRGVPINLRPRHHPTDIALADRCTIAVAEAGGDVWAWAEAAGRGVWVDEVDMADEREILARLQATGADEARAAALLERARSPEIETVRQRNTQDAIAADAVGVPAYTLRGEVFWGQDRIEALDAMLASGREPFAAAVG